jgi:hypothetical protein
MELKFLKTKDLMRRESSTRDEITDPDPEIPEEEMQVGDIQDESLKMRLCQKIQELSYQESMISAKRLEEYLLSAKPQDKIIQESQGGNFISNMDHTIYVPISILNSIICRN